jgi:diacylglycerol O-acyltransferase / wax synthase
VSNLLVEDRGLPVHVAALAILEGTPLIDASGQLRLDELRGMVEQRLDLTPRFRQVLEWHASVWDREGVENARTAVASS